MLALGQAPSLCTTREPLYLSRVTVASPHSTLKQPIVHHNRHPTITARCSVPTRRTGFTGRQLTGHRSLPDIPYCLSHGAVSHAHKGGTPMEAQQHVRCETSDVHGNPKSSPLTQEPGDPSSNQHTGPLPTDSALTDAPAVQAPSSTAPSPEDAQQHATAPHSASTSPHGPGSTSGLGFSQADFQEYWDVLQQLVSELPDDEKTELVGMLAGVEEQHILQEIQQLPIPPHDRQAVADTIFRSKYNDPSYWQETLLQPMFLEALEEQLGQRDFQILVKVYGPDLQALLNPPVDQEAVYANVAKLSASEQKRLPLVIQKLNMLEAQMDAARNPRVLEEQLRQRQRVRRRNLARQKGMELPPDDDDEEEEGYGEDEGEEEAGEGRELGVVDAGPGAEEAAAAEAPAAGSSSGSRAGERWRQRQRQGQQQQQGIAGASGTGGKNRHTMQQRLQRLEQLGQRFMEVHACEEADSGLRPSSSEPSLSLPPSLPSSPTEAAAAEQAERGAGEEGAVPAGSGRPAHADEAAASPGSASSSSSSWDRRQHLRKEPPAFAPSSRASPRPPHPSSTPQTPSPTPPSPSASSPPAPGQSPGPRQQHRPEPEGNDGRQQGSGPHAAAAAAGLAGAGAGPTTPADPAGPAGLGGLGGGLEAALQAMRLEVAQGARSMFADAMAKYGQPGSWQDPRSKELKDLIRIQEEMQWLSSFTSDEDLAAAGTTIQEVMDRSNALSAQVLDLIQRQDQISDPAVRCVLDFMQSQLFKVDDEGEVVVYWTEQEVERLLLFTQAAESWALYCDWMRLVGRNRPELGLGREELESTRLLQPRWWAKPYEEMEPEEREAAQQRLDLALCDWDVVGALAGLDADNIRFLTEMEASNYSPATLLKWCFHPVLGQRIRSGQLMQPGAMDGVLREAYEAAQQALVSGINGGIHPEAL